MTPRKPFATSKKAALHSVTALSSALAVFTTPANIVLWASLDPRTAALLRQIGIERGAFPVYTFDHPSSWPRGVAYPREDMLHHYGDDFFTNSISWMMALAIHELGPGGGKIGLYGVDMAMVSEYAKERAGVLHFKQVARHLGIDMVIPRASALHVKPPPYPGNCESAFARKYLERGADLDKRYEAAKAQLRALELAVAKLEGHREERDFTWMHLGIYYER